MKDTNPWLWFFLRLFLGGIFAYAGAIKLLEPIENFRGVVAHYEIIPYSLVPVIAFSFPWLEFIFGVLLILGYAPRLSAAALSVLSAGFVVLLTASGAIFEHGDQSCGCFGETGIQFTVRQVFSLDLINTFIGICLFRRTRHALSLDSLLTA